MNKIKRFMIPILVLSLCLCLSSCLKTDIAIEIKEDRTATLSYKLSMTEELYEALVKMENVTEDKTSPASEEDATVNDTQEPTDEATKDDEELDLTKFVKETIDGKTYYSYTERKENLSLQQLVDELHSIEIQEGIKLVDSAKINITERGEYTFTIVTGVVDKDSIQTGENLSLASDWLTMSLTIKMPGEVSQKSEGAIIDEANGTVKFTLDDFTSAKTLSVTTQPTVNYTPLYIIWGVGGAVVIFCFVMFFVSRNKKKKPTKPTLETQGRTLNDDENVEEDVKENESERNEEDVRENVTEENNE